MTLDEWNQARKFLKRLQEVGLAGIDDEKEIENILILLLEDFVDRGQE